MTMDFDIEKFFEEERKREEDRLKMIEEQIRKGCDKCSQWDEYFGCRKCENL